MKSLNKTVLIFGASSGIGKETSKLFFKDGAIVYNASRSPSDVDGIINICCDVTDGRLIENAVDLAASVNGNIDYMIYCAGFSMAAPTEKVTESDMRYLFETNFFGFAKAVQKTLPFMKKGGRIIAVSSVGGTAAIPFDSFYSASKAAMDIFVKAVNREVNDYGIFLTTVKVGGTATGFTFKRKIYDENVSGKYASKLNNAAEALASIEQNGMSPEKVAEIIFNAAVKSKKEDVSAGIVNALICSSENLLPDKLNAIITDRIYNI